LVAIAFLLHPRGLVVLQYAWTEPFVMLAVGFCAWAAIRKNTVALGVAVGALIAMKQYGVLWIPALWAAKCLGWREIRIGVSVAAVLMLPFFLWHPSAFWRGVVEFQFQQPFRSDSLSVLAAVEAVSGIQLSAAVGFVVAVAAACLVVRRSAPGVPSAGLGGAAIFLAFFVFNKQAFLNYYWFSGSLMILALYPPNLGPKAFAAQP
jgi:hypothetical protein